MRNVALTACRFLVRRSTVPPPNLPHAAILRPSPCRVNSILAAICLDSILLSATTHQSCKSLHSSRLPNAPSTPGALGPSSSQPPRSRLNHFSRRSNFSYS